MKDDLVYVGHMLDTARSVANKVDGLDRAAFDADENLQLAIVHLIQVIGEAAARVSSNFRSAHSEVPWQVIVGMRHKIVHDYLYVNYDLVWDAATNDVPTLISLIEPLIGGA